MEAEWVSVPRVRKDIFGFHFYGVILKNKRRASTTRSFEWCEETDFRKISNSLRGVWVREGETPSPPLECLQIGRTDFRIAKRGRLLKGPLRTLFGSFVTGAVADCCLMLALCIMGFVWRDNNRSEGSVMQLFDILFQNVSINIKLSAFVKIPLLN